MSWRNNFLWLWIACGCQDHVFVYQPNQRIGARAYEVDIGVNDKTDILFVIDNSGSMGDEQVLLTHALTTFIEALTASANAYQVGVVTTDIQRRPREDCDPCCDVDTDGDGLPDWSNCDDGRLVAGDFSDGVFERPADRAEGEEEEAARERVDALISDFQCTVLSLGTEGSAYEAPLEAMRRALDPDYDDVVRYLNRDFLRPDASVAVIFVTDEDDCSMGREDWYREFGRDDSHCYDVPRFPPGGETLIDTGSYVDFLCGLKMPAGVLPEGSPCPSVDMSQAELEELARGVLSADASDGEVSDKMTEILVMLKRAYESVRVAGIFGGVRSETAGALGFAARGCATQGYVPPTGGGQTCGDGATLDIGEIEGTATDACGCWANRFVVDTREISAAEALSYGGETDFFCRHMSTYGNSLERVPDVYGAGGCRAVPGGRLVSFLEEVRRRRLASGNGESGVRVDSICEPTYGETLAEIARGVVLSNCFSLDQVPHSPDEIEVVRNGEILRRVNPGDSHAGWSYNENPDGTVRLCLEGGLENQVGDALAIRYVVDRIGF